MGGAGNCLSSCQFHSSTYTHVISAFHFLPRQNNLCLRTSLTTTLADALGLSRDCHCEPRLVGAWQSLKAGRSWAIGLPWRCHCERRQLVVAEFISASRSGTSPDPTVLSLRGMIVPKQSRSGIPRLRSEQAPQSLYGPGKAHLKSKMRCD